VDRSVFLETQLGNQQHDGRSGGWYARRESEATQAPPFTGMMDTFFPLSRVEVIKRSPIY
jgi:hypothetical protein